MKLKTAALIYAEIESVNSILKEKNINCDVFGYVFDKVLIENNENLEYHITEQFIRVSFQFKTSNTSLIDFDVYKKSTRIFFIGIKSIILSSDNNNFKTALISLYVD